MNNYKKTNFLLLISLFIGLSKNFCFGTLNPKRVKALMLERLAKTKQKISSADDDVLKALKALNEKKKEEAADVIFQRIQKEIDAEPVESPLTCLVWVEINGYKKPIFANKTSKNTTQSLASGLEESLIAKKIKILLKKHTEQAAQERSSL